MDTCKRLKLAKICNQYDNITKKEFDTINLNKYCIFDFMRISNYCLYSAFEICCINNNFLIVKYFCSFSKYKSVKFVQLLLIRIPNIHKCLCYCYNNNNLKMIKFIIIQFNMTKKDFTVESYLYNSYIYKHSLSFLKFIIKKFKMVKSDFLEINRRGMNHLDKYYFYDNVDCLIYIIKKFNIKKQEMLYCNRNRIIYFFFTSQRLTIKNMKYFIEIWNINKSDLFNHNNEIDIYHIAHFNFNYNVIKYIIIKYRLNSAYMYNIGYKKEQRLYDKKIIKLMSCNINIITNKYINYNKIFKTIYL